MNTVTKFIIGAVIVAIVFFYVGVKYSQSHPSVATTTTAGAYAGRSGAGTARTGATAAGGVVSGTLLSIDPQGITVSVTGGGSKIIFTATSTSIMTTAQGSASDLSVGDNVMVIGQTNSDGSVTARTIDIRPASTAPAASQ